MLYFSKLWAEKLKGTRIGKGKHQKVIEDIKIEDFDFEQYSLQAKNIFFKNFKIT